VPLPNIPSAQLTPYFLRLARGRLLTARPFAALRLDVTLRFAATFCLDAALR